MFNRTLILIAAYIGILLFGIVLITLGSILPALESRFENKGLDKGLLAAMLSAGILTGSVLFGPIADRYGYKLLFVISTLISAIGFQGLAFTSSISLLYVFMFLIGAGGGVLNGGTNALVADISLENKAASLSLLGVFFGIGALGMPLLLSIVSEEFSFSSILSSVGFFMLLPVIYFLAIIFPVPKQPQGFPLKQGFRLLKEPALLLTALFLFFQSGVESLVNNWSTSYLTERDNVSNDDALMMLSFYMVGLTIARLFLGAILKKISSYAVLMYSFVLVIAGNVLFIYVNDYELAFTGLIITGIGLAAGFPVILSYIGQLYPNLSGTAFSIALVVALSGNMLINYLFGRIESNYSIRYLPFLIIACVVCLFIIALLIKRTISSRVKL